MLKITPYQEEYFIELQKLLDDLCEYLIPLDPDNLLVQAPNQSADLAKVLLAKVKKHDGIIFFATEKENFLGVIVAYEEVLDEQDLAEGCKKVKTAHISDLIVTKDARKKGVGKFLLQATEEHFCQKGYRNIRLNVFVPNKNAHATYQHLGYKERNIEMIKVL